MLEINEEKQAQLTKDAITSLELISISIILQACSLLVYFLEN